MIKLQKNLITTLLIGILFFTIPFNFAYSIEEVQATDSKLNQELQYMELLMEFIEANYVDGITDEELIEGAMKGLFYNLDEYSNYYTPEEFEELNQVTTGNFGGVGIVIEQKGEYITVVSPVNGTPGARSGIKPGDKIISVDDTDIKGFTANQAVEIIRGEPGTNVKLGVLRKGSHGVLYFDITREMIKINPITYEILDNDIGYIKISQFNSNTLENIIKALNEMDNNSIKKIVIDLRYNPGGYLDEVINVLRYFIPEGPIVHIKEANGELETHNSYIPAAKYDLAVLVNEGSASASEIFAGAVQDSKVGTIIGTTTFGKGTVQSVIPLSNGGGIKLTIAEYLTANKNKVNGIGIKPDIEIENTLPSYLDLSDIPKLKKDRKPTLNTVGLDVLGAEMILELLGYNINTPDGILDEQTFNSIKQFQTDQSIYSYGTLDFTTQDTLTKALVEYVDDEVVDKQLEKAVEVLRR